MSLDGVTSASEIRQESRLRALKAAQGLEEFDLLLINAQLVDVGCAEIRAADVGVVDNMIVSIHPCGSRNDAKTVFDCGGKYLAPGFIDMHVHFESSMLTPGAYSEVVCPRGTTTVFADPHELANVAGLQGVRYALDASRNLPVRFILQAPSCVPPEPGLELSGAELSAADIRTMLSWPEMAGLAEVMDMLGVLKSKDRMVDVVSAALDSSKLVSGHAAGLSGKELQAYMAAGMTSDHEIFASSDVMERLRAGMTVELRATVDAILPDIVQELAKMAVLPVHLVAATDDLFAITLSRDGGIDALLRRLIQCGMDPVVAIRCATYHAAYRLQRNDLGLIAPGRLADMILLSDLETVAVEEVFVAGCHVASGGKMKIKTQEGPSTVPLDSVKLDPLTARQLSLSLDVPDGLHRIRVVAGAVVTYWEQTQVFVKDGIVEIPDGYITQFAVHRHGRAEPTPQGALLAGWGNWNGAIATTISHDTHNLVVFGRDPSDMAIAANRVIADGGGVAVARNGEILASIALPIAGILSPLAPDEVIAQQHEVQEAARSVGLFSDVVSQPLFQVFLSSLACLPGPHITDVGLIDGTTGELIGSMLAV